MASIYLNRKDGKIVSFKFKAFLGRDENGRQIVKCTTWTTDCSLSEKRLLQLAKKESTIWEKRISKEVEEERRLFQANVITFSLFVEKVWFVAQVKEKEIRETTQVFYRYLMDKMCEYFRNKKLKDITSKQIEQYFDYLKKSGKTLSQKTLRHHYTTLHSIFKYAVKKNYILNSPLNKVDAPKLAKKKVDALSKSDVLIFMKELQNLSLMHRTMNRNTSLDEMQKVCKTEQELCFVLSSLDDMKEREKAVLLPATLRRRAMLTFQNVSIEEITVQDVQVKLLIGYSKALAVKKWLEKRYGNKN